MLFGKNVSDSLVGEYGMLNGGHNHVLGRYLRKFSGKLFSWAL